jgi:TPR repeat protein
MDGMHKRHPKAYYSMGYMHATGKGVPQDLLLARKAYQDAASLSSEVSDLMRTIVFRLGLSSVVAYRISAQSCS